MSDYSWAFSPNVYNFNTVDKVDAEVELEQVHNFLDKAGIRHWLSSGTMLGIYRDNDFLEGDTDIDFGIRGEDVISIQDAIPWKLRPAIKTERIWQSVFVSPRNIAIDLMWFWEDGDNIINKNDGGTWVKPKEKMKYLQEIEFKGVVYPMPDPEWYLENRFRDWKTRLPKEGKNWWSFVAKNGFLK